MRVAFSTQISIVIGAVAFVSMAVVVEAQQSDAEGANAIMPWAYVLNDPAPEDGKTPDPNEVVSVPESDVSMPRSAITIDNGPPDWHPDSHPPMPPVVAKGGGDGVVACGYCHLPNGQGKPENAGLAGQPYEYIVQQMTDWRNGNRRTGEPRMGPPAYMERIGAATTDEEVRIAAEYFSSIDFKPWVRVVEAEMIPRMHMAGWIHQVVEGGGTETLGVRVVETPENLGRTKLRDDASGFIAYVPPGSIDRGRELVSTGGTSAVACTVCHGDDLRGMGPVPALAGRSPTYMARQLYDMQQGKRNGAWSSLMKDAVANLSIAEIVDIVSYTASLEP